MWGGRETVLTSSLFSLHSILEYFFWIIYHYTVFPLWSLLTQSSLTLCDLMDYSPPISLSMDFYCFFSSIMRQKCIYYQVEWALRSWWENTFFFETWHECIKWMFSWFCLWNLATLKLIWILCDSWFFFFKEFYSFSVPYIFKFIIGKINNSVQDGYDFWYNIMCSTWKNLFMNCN